MAFLAKKERNKAQVSVELFLGITLFVLVLYWMSHFVAVQRDANTALTDQEKLVAASLVQIANSVCASNTSVDYALPCIYLEGRNVSYHVGAGGSNTILIIPAMDALSARQAALCNFSLVDVKARCITENGENNAGKVCVNASFEGGVRRVAISSGECE